MTWQAFERDKPFVTQALQQGHFDYMEVVGAVEETRFFRLLLDQGVLDALAADYPTPRQKEEVPLWLYLASELTLRLHGASGFGAYPYVLHCGGLVDALGPGQVQHQLDPQSGQCRTTMRGYNHKNHYTRRTPCDKDFLRKMGKDTRAQALEHWFGTSVVRQYQALDAFDAEGLFLIDGTYVFVPTDNDRYEGSSLLRFDERGHPIGREQFEALPLKRQQRCAWRRCYRAVTLSHTTRDQAYSLRCGTGVEEDHRQEKCFWDMTHFRSPAFSLVVNQILFVELAYSLIQIFLRQVGRNELVGKTRQRLLDALLPNQSPIALYYQQRFGMFDRYEYQELLLTLRDGARRKLLGKTRRLRRSQLQPPELPWRPE